MADFGKRLKKGGADKKIHPIEIYKDLDRSSEAGPLRTIQEEILNSWFQEFQTKKDVILKLHTGQGKTLVGLLILQSLLNQDKGPCLYLCPNIYLVRQTIEQAKKFGIPYCVIGADKELPHDFLKGTKILICHIQKLFHGYTRFGLNNASINVGGIILDDSHACIESIKDAFTIKVANDKELYGKILNLFEADLEKQAKGTYSEILGKEQTAYLPIPYWAWIDKSTQVTSLLSEYRDEDDIKYTWPLIKNNISDCQCYISGQYLEISPYINSIHQFGSFNDASHRILMSATTMNDSFFIKGLNIDKHAVKNPLTVKGEKWSGEKMILIPYLINESLNRISIINQYAKPLVSKNFGIVVLLPSFKATKIYEEQGCIIAKRETIDSDLQNLKNGYFDKPLVIVNRYDGIDLPDSTCRLLIVDSKPYSESLSDKYEEFCRNESDLTNIRIAQKIEQGFGRSVRGEKDFSVIIVIGGDLISFLRNPKTKRYFSIQTRKQIEIGHEIAEIASEDVDPRTTDMMKIVHELIKQCIVQRDPEWKRFYEERMNEIEIEAFSFDITELLEIEREAESLNILGRHKDARDLVQEFLDKNNLPSSETGWYLQMMARFSYQESKTLSNQLQTSAFRKNWSLLKPNEGYKYKKIELIQSNRIQNIIDWAKVHSRPDMMDKVNEIYAGLSFEESSENFESAMQELGKALGFESQRPDKEDKDGPDNLWALGNNEYLLFECKNQILDKREEISKSETGQMNNHCGWFKKNYNDSHFKPIMIVQTKNVSALGSFNFEVEIIRKNNMKLLRDNFKSFYEELKRHDLSSLNFELVQKMINMHHLDNESIKNKYSEKPYQR